MKHISKILMVFLALLLVLNTGICTLAAPLAADYELLKSLGISLNQDESEQFEMGLLRLDNILSSRLGQYWGNTARRSRIISEIKKLRKVDILVFIGTTEVTSDVAPVIIEDKVFIPMRALMDGFNKVATGTSTTTNKIASVDWNEQTSTATLIKGSARIAYNTKTSELSVNGVPAQADPAPQIVRGRLMFPIRFVAETFNERVEWDAINRCVLIGNYDNIVEVTDDIFQRDTTTTESTTPSSSESTDSSSEG